MELPDWHALALLFWLKPVVLQKKDYASGFTSLSYHEIAFV